MSIAALPNGEADKLQPVEFPAAPAALDAPSTLTLYAGPLKYVAGFALDSVMLIWHLFDE